MGVITKRDKFIIDLAPQPLEVRIRHLANKNIDEKEITILYGLKDTYEWKLTPARAKIIKEGFNEKKLIKYAYRPFDTRYIYFEDVLIARSVREVMNNLLEANMALNIMRHYYGTDFSHVFISEYISDINYLTSAKGQYVFPLYLYPGWQLLDKEALKSKRISNFTSEFLQAIKEPLGLEPDPEEIFYYIYAVLFSPAYRERYEEFLKIDFPRVPLPSDYEVFKELSNLGKELVDLHLLKASVLDEDEIGFPKSGSYDVEKISYDEGMQRISINKEQYFGGVSKEVWEYRIGAYKVMEKYLKDRKKRKLSLDEINHYIKVAKAIRLTIELQGKIDNVYRKIEI
jgi:predicted helicase